MDTENRETGLVPVERLDVPALFTAEGGMETMLALITERAMAVPRDVSTAAGRKAIAGVSYNVARSKTFLDAKAQEFMAEQKRIVDTVNGRRKLMKDTLDALREEVRKPLTEWETRRDRWAEEIAAIKAKPAQCVGCNAPTIERWIANLSEPANIDPEFAEEYRAAVKSATAELTAMLEYQRQRDAEKAELAKLRAEAEARAKADEAERLRREGEERERVRQEKLTAEAAAKAERDRIAAEQKAERERLAAIRRAELEKAELEAQVRRQAEEAERQKREAAEAAERARLQAEADKAAAVKAAQDHAAAVAMAEKLRLEGIERERQAREANQKHRAEVEDAITAALCRFLSADDARSVVENVKAGNVPGLVIQY